jgi:GntR family transcriptional regulator/MocR family aminotransferase
MRNRTEAALPIVLNTAYPQPLKRQLYLALRGFITSGTLPAGSRLPSTRILARNHSISRSTVVDVFEQLLADGFTTGTIGSGTFVASISLPLSSLSNGAHRSSRVREAVRLSDRGSRLLSTAIAYAPPKRLVGAFRNGLPALDLFPRESWARHLSRAARNASASSLDYGDAAGLLALRKAIAERLAITRSTRCVPEQIFVVDGTQHAFDTIAQLLLQPGDPACVEDPGYPGAWSAIRAAGAKLLPVPVDNEGMDVEQGVKQCPEPHAIFVSPSHQYPMGVALSTPRRLSLLHWAQQSGAWIIEDDFENEFEYSGRPLHSLHSLDTSGRVLYVGSFSKTLAPSLRIGYVVVPERLIDAFTAARRIQGRSCKALEQAALASFIVEGAFARHVRRMRDIYQERQAVLIEEVERQLSGVATIRKAQSGIHLLAHLAASLEDIPLSKKVAAKGIDAVPLTPLALSPRRCGGLLLGYAVASPQEIRKGVEVIARCISQC